MLPGTNYIFGEDDVLLTKTVLELTASKLLRADRDTKKKKDMCAYGFFQSSSRMDSLPEKGSFNYQLSN